MTAEHIQNSDQRIEDHFEDVLDMVDSPVLISLKLNPDRSMIILIIRFIMKIIMKIFYKIFFKFYFVPYREFFAEKFSKYSVSNSYKNGEKDRSFPTISKLFLQTYFRIAILLLYLR